MGLQNIFNLLIQFYVFVKLIGTSTSYDANAKSDLPDQLLKSPLNNEFDLIQMLDSHSSAQIKNLYLLTKKMLKRMQTQNEQNNDKLADCYQKLGKYTRLMIVNNKRRAIKNNKYEDISNESAQETQQDKPESQMSFILLRELNFYLAELERNYKIIQDLQIKLDNLNKSNSIYSFSSSLSGSDLKNLMNKTESEEADCNMLTGSGFLQIEIDSHENLNEPNTNLHKKHTVLCENQWLVIQQRLNGFETNFNRTWQEYLEGFGSLRGDFWLGLDVVSKLTQKRSYKLRIELTDWSDQVFVAEYENFEIGNEDDYFRLSLSEKYSGNASSDFLDDIYYGLLSQNGAYFSTYDNNKKLKSNTSGNNQQKITQKNCALRSGGGWWFNNFSNCLPVNLNGMYVTGASAPSARGIKWQAIRVQDKNYSLKKSKMKIKPNY